MLVMHLCQHQQQQLLMLFICEQVHIKLCCQHGSGFDEGKHGQELQQISHAILLL